MSIKQELLPYAALRLPNFLKISVRYPHKTKAFSKKLSKSLKLLSLMGFQAQRKGAVFVGLLLFTSGAWAFEPSPTQLDFYPCGAGIAHPSISQEFSAGLDHASYEIEDLSIPLGHPYRYRSDRLQVGQGSSWAHSSFSWFTKISNLSFHFSTESYGTQFYVDLCYTTTGIPGEEQNGVYGFTSQIQVIQSLVDSKTYSQISQLIGMVSLECDLKGRGQNKTSFDPNRFETDFSYETSTFSLSSGYANVVFPINLIQEQIPLACRARLYFEENRKTQRLHKSSIRQIDTLSTLSHESYGNFY